MKSPKADKRNKRARRKALLERARTYGDQLARAMVNRFRRGQRAAQSAQGDAAVRAALLNGMTNWQRNICLRACKGNLDKFSTDTLRAYASTVHWKKNPGYCQGGAVTGKAGA